MFSPGLFSTRRNAAQSWDYIRGKGRISDDERASYHKSVDVFFQTKAWVDGTVCTDWVEKTLSVIVNKEDRFVLFVDNLSAQTTDEFKDLIASICRRLQ